MHSRRLLSSLAGSVVVAALMGCNAIIGNEDITYTDPSDPAAKNPPDKTDDTTQPDAGRDTGSEVKDADAAADVDQEDGGVASDAGPGFDAAAKD